MAEFKLSEEVDELKFDFQIKQADDSLVGPKGPIPEPSATQIQNFRTAIAEMLSEMLPEDESGAVVPADDPQQASKMRRALLETIGKDQTASQQKALQAIAAVCSDSPSFDILNELPWRHQQAFSGWISGKFLLPQTLTPATKA